MTEISKYNVVENLRTHKEVNWYIAACFEIVAEEGGSFNVTEFVTSFISDSIKALEKLNHV